MRILNNPILGKIFAGSSLKLNNDGLFRKILVNNRQEFIFLTNNVKSICDILEIDFDEFDKSEGNKSYDIIINSKYFNSECFELKDAKHSTAIKLFLDYLDNEKYQSCPGIYIRTEHIENIIQIPLRNRIDDMKRVLSAPHQTLSGEKLLPYLKNYDKRNFQKHFENFHKSFSSFYDEKKFLLDKDIEEISKYYKQINNI